MARKTAKKAKHRHSLLKKTVRKPARLPAALMPGRLRKRYARVEKILEGMSGIAPMPEPVVSMRKRLKAYDDRRRELLGALPRPVSLFHPFNYAYDSVFNRLVEEEIARAREKHEGSADIRHHHSVIREEFDEFETEVYADAPRERVMAELVQLAAMCRRCAEDVFKVGVE